jgi:hypothetical protein
MYIDLRTGAINDGEKAAPNWRALEHMADADATWKHVKESMLGINRVCFCIYLHLSLNGPESYDVEFGVSWRVYFPLEQRRYECSSYFNATCPDLSLEV